MGGRKKLVKIERAREKLVERGRFKWLMSMHLPVIKELAVRKIVAAEAKLRQKV